MQIQTHFKTVLLLILFLFTNCLTKLASLVLPLCYGNYLFQFQLCKTHVHDIMSHQLQSSHCLNLSYAEVQDFLAVFFSNCGVNGMLKQVNSHHFGIAPLYKKVKELDKNYENVGNSSGTALKGCSVPSVAPKRDPCEEPKATRLCHCWVVSLVLKSIGDRLLSAWTILLNRSLKMMVTLTSDG